jgi:hypothetical protein
MSRLRKVLLFALLIFASWMLMQVVHESGHILGAWLSGGTVTEVVLNPLTISRTDVRPNPHPLIVVWAGPIVGVVLPIAIWIAARLIRFRYANLTQFFAGFCLIANGAYIGIGSFGRVGDCGEMLRNGSPIWLLWVFGAVTLAAGLYLWHGLTRKSPRDAAEDEKV